MSSPAAPAEPRITTDHRAAAYMRRALALAERGAGAVSPNPLVGAVLVGPGGEVLGEGWHGHYGGPHAEVEAVRDAEARGHAGRLAEATLYVSLEPCSHTGKTPPCTDLILEKRIPRVVVAMEDPFPAVAGRGIERLRAAGVDVTVGVMEDEAKRLNEAFLHHVATGRPLVTLKIAQTLDGRVATRRGDSRWITDEPARALVHRWRATLDGVLVGTRTALRDDPALTVRHTWPGRPADFEPRQPVRVVLDRTGQLPPTLQLFTDAHAAQTVAAVAEDAEPAYETALRERGGHVLRLPEQEDRLDLRALLEALGQGVGPHRPMQSLLVEAGPGLATALLRRDLVDRLALFIAPKVIGEGLPAIGDLGIERVGEALTFHEHSWELVGDDLLFFGYCRAL